MDFSIIVVMIILVYIFLLYRNYTVWKIRRSYLLLSLHLLNIKEEKESYKVYQEYKKLPSFRKMVYKFWTPLKKYEIKQTDR